MNRLALVLIAVAAPRAGAQDFPFAIRPPAAGVVVTKDVEYARADTMTLRMDVYRPADAGSRRLPTLVFFNRATGADRSGPFYTAWARVAASRGVVAVLPDVRGGREAADFQLLLGHLTTRGGDVGVDGNAFAVFAGSGNVFAAFPFVEDPKQTAIKAAVMYYGTGPVTQFRLDLPVLYVRAGLDRPPVNQGITELAVLAVTQNAPVTLLNHASGYHAFETANDDDATRDVMEQTISFVKRATSSSYQAAIARGIREASAAGFVMTRDYKKAAEVYAELVAARPTEPRLRLSYGEALLGDSQFGAACAEFEKLRGKGLGPRDLGLPAARACMQKGDADAAIAWLKSIPTRFLPPSVQTEAVFAPVAGREDFKALFPAR
jgi:dienelactone hydrolase